MEPLTEEAWQLAEAMFIDRRQRRGRAHPYGPVRA